MWKTWLAILNFHFTHLLPSFIIEAIKATILVSTPFKLQVVNEMRVETMREDFHSGMKWEDLAQEVYFLLRSPSSCPIFLGTQNLVVG